MTKVTSTSMAMTETTATTVTKATTATKVSGANEAISPTLQSLGNTVWVVLDGDGDDDEGSNDGDDAN